MIHYNGRDVTINVDMLVDIKKLGFGNYGSVMLAEVKNHEDIKMAVKVRRTGICHSSELRRLGKPHLNKLLRREIMSAALREMDNSPKIRELDIFICSVMFSQVSRMIFT